MGDDETKSTRSRFLSKIQRSKSTKNEVKAQQHQLNDDVADFLKPSTDRAALIRPRIDIAVAQRWPEAIQVDNPNTLPIYRPSKNVNEMRKKRRKEGLVVAFAVTAPEIIGEGGDESPYPTVEISKMKERSIRPAVYEYRRSVDNASPYAAQQQSKASFDRSVKPLRRSNTGHHDLMPVDKRYDSKLDAGSGGETYGGGSPQHTENSASQHDRKRTIMAAREGMALRRASSIPGFDDEAEVHKDDNSPPQFGPGTSSTNFSLPARQQVPVFSDSEDARTRSGQLQADERHKVVITPQHITKLNQSMQRERGLSYSQSHEQERQPTLPVLIDPQSYSPERESTLHSQSHAQSESYPVHQPQSYTRRDHETTPASELQVHLQQDRKPISTVTSNSPFDDPKYQQTIAQGPRHAPRFPTSAVEDDTTADAQLYPGKASYASPAEECQPISNAHNCQPSYQQHTLDIPSKHPLISHIAPNHPQFSSYTSSNHVQYASYTPHGNRSPLLNDTTSERSQFSLTRKDGSLGLESAISDRPFGFVPSPQPSPVGPSSNEAVFVDFGSRVAHMKGVFQLTAEKEQSSDKSTPLAWFRTACWWYLKGKTGLEHELRQRAQKQMAARGILLQGHVDLAKAWWILNTPLDIYCNGDQQLRGQTTDVEFNKDIAELRSHMQSLCLSLGRNDILPPHASLIQGQDTRIWLSNSLGLNSSALHVKIPAIEALPLGDTAKQFNYSRFPVEVSLSNAETQDTSSVSCLLTVVRDVNSYETGVIVASQSDMVTLAISETSGVSWRDVLWSSSMSALNVQLSDGTSLLIRLLPADYRSLGNMIEYTRKIVNSMQAAQEENRIFQAQLTDLQYTTSATPSPFPKENIAKCRVILYKRRDARQGHRLLFITSPSTKVLSCASHRLPQDVAAQIDSTISGRTFMLNFREERRQAQAVMHFQEIKDIMTFQTALNDQDTLGFKENLTSPQPPMPRELRSPSQTLTTNNTSICTLPLLEWQPRPLTDIWQEKSLVGDITSPLQWRSISVSRVHHQSSDDDIDGLEVVLSHMSGSFTDHFSLDKGEVHIRLPLTQDNSIQVFHEPQRDFNASLDTHNCPPVVPTTVGRVVQLARHHPTIYTYQFANLQHLHQFQHAISGYTVQFDAIASSFAISRRRMVVPIHHKWLANDVRCQVISNEQKTVIKILVFMHDFEQADAMCFQVKSTDVFERIKGDNKGKKWSIKLVDAKFSLPPKLDNLDDEQKARRLFVNLDGLEYAEEHDDITIGFDTDEGELRA